MRSALSQCNTNLDRARDLAGLAQSISSMTTKAIDVSDLLRASLVLSVSAVDHLVHEIVRIAIVEMARSLREPTDGYFNFKVSLRGVTTLLSDPDSTEWLNAEIRTRHGWLSFQRSEKIAEAMRIACPKNIWPAVGRHLGQPAAEVRATLDLIVDRRNKIAHEADLDPSSPGLRWPITPQIAFEAIEFLGRLADALVSVAL